MKKRSAIIALGMFTNYTGTATPISYEFLCWENDPDVKDKIKSAEEDGCDTVSISIPIED